MRTIKWGIIGLGKIADKFCQGLQHADNCELYALASGSAEKELIYREKYSFRNFFSNYASMLADPQVDIIYIATPNHLHYEQSKQALLAGKHVLCEKPVCLHPSQLAELQSLAISRNLFFMEALWTMFLPGMYKVKQLITDNTYGKLLKVEATFGFKAQYREDSRLFNPDMGGGSIYDIGIYPLFLALHCLGYPDQLSAIGQLAPTGCDSSAQIVMEYSGAQALLSCSFEEQLSNDALLSFEHAQVRIAPMWHMPSPLDIVINGQPTITLPMGCAGNGYECEAEHAAHCILNGISESPVLSHKMSFELATLIESALKQIKK